MKRLRLLFFAAISTASIIQPAHSENKAPLSKPAQVDATPYYNSNPDCGTYPGIEQDIYKRHLLAKTAARAKLPTTQTRDIGNLAILEDDGSLIFEDANGLHIDDYAVANAFYATHPDSFDFITMFRNFDANMFGFAYHFHVQNQVLGIGLSTFDNTFALGSTGRLLGFSNQNDINYQVDDPHFHMYRTHSTMTGMLHETMHQWAAFLNNNNQLVNSSHWYTFSDTRSNWADSTTSAMEGYKWAYLSGPAHYQGLAAANGLSPLDLYVMGLYGPSQVPPIFYLQNPSIVSPMGMVIPPYYALPIDLRANGTPKTLTIDGITFANGERFPDSSASQKNFNMAFILVVKNGEVPKGEEIDRIERIRLAFQDYFYQSTESLATMNTVLFGGNPMEIVSTELRGAGLGYPYSEQVYAVGGNKPYNWTLSGSLPSGLSFNTSSGVISGTPTVTGSFPLTIIADDNGPKADTASLTLVVADTGQSQIVINELELWERYNVGAGIELYNAGAKAVNLSNWVVEANGVAGRITYTIPSSPAPIIPPKGFLVLLESSGINTSRRLFIGEDIAWITGGSGFCSLKDNFGNGVDFVRFGNSAEPPPAGTSWSGPNPTVQGSFHNLVRDSSGADNDQSSDWAECNGNLGRKNLCLAVPLCAAIPGDANSSNTLSLADPVSIINYVFNRPGCSPHPSCWLSGLYCRGDWNGDLTVSLADVIRGVNFILSRPGGPWDPVPTDICCSPVP